MNIQNVSELGNKNNFEKSKLFERKNVVIVSSTLEDYNLDSTVNYIKFLNSKYAELVGDVAPYHYYVDTDGTIYSSKFDTLKVNATSELSGFDNDISILAINKDLGNMPDIQKSSLSYLVAQICDQYAISGSNILFFPAAYVESNESKSVYDSIKSTVIELKHGLNPLNYIYENTDNGISDISDSIGIGKAEENCNTFKDLSVRYGISENKLKILNPHISTLNPTPGDLIFYAQTSVTKASDSSMLVRKMSDMYYKLCEVNIPQD